MTMMNYDFAYHETLIDILARKAGFSRIFMDENQLEVLFIPIENYSRINTCLPCPQKMRYKRPLLDPSSHSSNLSSGFPKPTQAN